MARQEHASQIWPNSFCHSRMVGITCAVVLAHVGLIWWLCQGVLNTPTTQVMADNIVMASVVMDLPAVPAPQPVAPKVETKIRPKLQIPLQPVPPSRVPLSQPTALPAQPTPAAVPAQAVPAEVVPAVAPPDAVNPLPPSPVATTAGSSRSGNPVPAPVAVVLPSSDADYLNNPAPAYPRMSRRLGEQGTVVLRVFISAEGRAEKVEVRTSSGYVRLDEVALETAQRWRYVPGKRGGTPEAMWFNVPIRFVLD
jgi:periplasmic protein TonB